MIETCEPYAVEKSKVPIPSQPLFNEQDALSHRFRDRFRLLRQVLRFGLVGGLNTMIDVLILNGLLWLFPTTSSLMLLAYNTLAYSLGAVNSFLLNKYWTFRYKKRTTRREVVRSRERRDTNGRP